MSGQSRLTWGRAKGATISVARNQRTSVSSIGEMWPAAILPAMALPAHRSATVVRTR